MERRKGKKQPQIGTQNNIPTQPTQPTPTAPTAPP